MRVRFWNMLLFGCDCWDWIGQDGCDLIELFGYEGSTGIACAHGLAALFGMHWMIMGFAEDTAMLICMVCLGNG